MAQRKPFWVIKICMIYFSVLWSVNVQATAQKVTFEKAKIRLGQKVLNVDVAETDEQQAHGLMFRKKLPQDQGMLFLYNDMGLRGFWMKNTLIPLSIGFFDEQRRLFQIESMNPVKSFLDLKVDQVQSHKPAKFALEVNQGWFKKNKVQLGAEFVWVTKPKSHTEAQKPSSR